MPPATVAVDWGAGAGAGGHRARAGRRAGGGARVGRRARAGRQVGLTDKLGEAIKVRKIKTEWKFPFDTLIPPA